MLTSDSSTQKYPQRERKDARSACLSFLKAIVRKRQRLQVVCFFLAINHKGWREKPNGWYKLSPLGKNQVGKFLPKAAQEAALQACGKKIANHAVRKTSISQLLDGGTPENLVA